MQVSAVPMTRERARTFVRKATAELSAGRQAGEKQLPLGNGLYNSA